jgi:hypothetical protein
MFSMQVVLAHLIFSRSKVAVVNDIYNSKEKLTKRHTRIIEGNGVNGFHPYSPESNALTSCTLSEPVLVFSGCSYNEDPDWVCLKMDEWIDKFPNLVLACDTFYPQFPKTHGDQVLQSDRILPNEEILKSLIGRHEQFNGVSASDPSLYCLNHISPASLEQVLSNKILSYKIPETLLKETAVLSQ